MRTLILISFFIVHSFQGNAQKDCRTQDYLQQLISSSLQVKESVMSRQDFITRQLNNPNKIFGSIESNAPQTLIIRIPVVVHILYNNNSQNISDAQVESQIIALNRDFRKSNQDIASIPQNFKNLAADCQFEFVLASSDPNGFKTNGIVRKKTSIQVFGLDDRIKYSSLGGDDAWDAAAYLNIWVGNLAGGLVGYSSPLGGPEDKDGVVIRYTAFGTMGTASAPFNMGRTATHEIGHWLGLRHIWGDQYCGDDDVEDTPKQQRASRGCPSGIITSCNNSGNMYMNYMDLTNDACMTMFTTGQRARMRAAFAPGGPRYNMLFSMGLNEGAEKPDEAEEKPQEIKVQLVRLYPNPVQDRMVLENLTEEKLNFTIFNQFGQVIKNFQSGLKITEVNVQYLPSGLYFITDERRRNIVRFIKK
jgi:hypothetical protein